MEALSSLESLIRAGLAGVAVCFAAWSVVQARRARPSSPRTGESAWTLVAMLTLAGVSAAVVFGSGRV